VAAKPDAAGQRRTHQRGHGQHPGDFQLQPADAGSYTVVVTNIAGAVSSAVATLTVNGTLSITTQPASQSAIVGANVNLA